MSGMMLAFSGGSYGAAPVNTVAPVVSGTATVGQTLSTTNGTWTGAPAPTFTYQWQRVTTNISGATSSTYTLVAADATNTIRCVVTATNTIAPSGVSANSNSTASVAAIVPGAPTIGTATATGGSTATVVYTAPASNGGATITSYTATSSPAGGTGTLSQAGSGTISVTGLSPLTSYTFTVIATNSVGQSAASAASNSITTTISFGDAYEGGYYGGAFTLTSGGTSPEFRLVIAPAASGQALSTYKLKTSNSNDTGTLSEADGKSNSAATNDASHPAAQFCEGLTIGGYSDWYLPSRAELIVAYVSLKPSTTSNNTSSGNTQFSAPPRSTFTAGTPAMTSATIFQVSGAEAFATSDYYWTSTQVGNYNPAYKRNRRQGFNDGQTGADYYKNNIAPVRAARRVAI